MSNLRDSWNDVKASLKGVLTLLKQNDPEGYEEAVKEVRTLGMDLLRDIEGLDDYDVKVYASGIFDDRHVVFKSVPGRNPDDILWDTIPIYHENKPAPFFKWMWKHNARFTSKGELVFTPYPEEIEKVKKKMARLAKEPSYTALP